MDEFFNDGATIRRVQGAALTLGLAAHDSIWMTFGLPLNSAALDAEDISRYAAKFECWHVKAEG